MSDSVFVDASKAIVRLLDQGPTYGGYHSDVEDVKDAIASGYELEGIAAEIIKQFDEFMNDHTGVIPPPLAASIKKLRIYVEDEDS